MNNEIKILDHGYLKLVECYGSDESIVEAARMSTDKGFKGWGPNHRVECKTQSPFIEDIGQCDCDLSIPGDEKLLDYLMRNRHTSPFEMAGAIFEVKLPIFVIREWHRHRTQSYNEMSGRYTELPNECYVPDFERLTKAKKKDKGQGSDEGIVASMAEAAGRTIEWNYNTARSDYKKLLGHNIAPEIARLVLPVNQYTKMRANANLLNWFRFLEQRLPENAQWEIRQYAQAVGSVLKELYPRSYALFEKYWLKI